MPAQRNHMNRVTTVHPVESVNRGISRGRRELEAETPEVLGEDGVNPNPGGGTSWSAWRAGRPSEQLTVGIEEELMVLDPCDWSRARWDVTGCAPPSRAAGEPKWTRNRFARDLALAPNDLIRRAITRLACR